MEQPAESIWLALCFSLRCALPMVLTLMLAGLLGRLDARWAREAKTTGGGATAIQSPCWQIQKCTAGQREYCPAYRQPERPCWKVHSQNGTILRQCQDCQVYQTNLALA